MAPVGARRASLDPPVGARRSSSTANTPATVNEIGGRLERTAAILERRGYAVSAARLGELCLGGTLPEQSVCSCVADFATLVLRDGLVLPPNLARGAPAAVAAIQHRAEVHEENAARCLPMALRFVRTLVRLSPYVLSVSIAGSLASGGFLVTDDVDLNLIVEDGRRHMAYVAVNMLGLAHALLHRRKPVDTHTRRPLAPRFMTANLILERSQCFPLTRQDEHMAYEFLASQPVYGVALWSEVVAANAGLRAHFPQLQAPGVDAVVPRRRALPTWLFPAALDRPARWIGRTAWRYMQWTRRKRPEALARVAYVRQTMQPYALFSDQ